MQVLMKILINPLTTYHILILFFVTVKMDLGKLPPSPNSNANRKPNLDPDRGEFPSGAIFRTPVKKFSYNLESIFPLLTNATAISYIARLIFAYP